MQKGYYLVAPDFVSSLYPDDDAACRCLSWLIKNFEPIIRLSEQGFLFSVIPICYMGCYPGIGFRSEQPQLNDYDFTKLSFAIEKAINAFLSEDRLATLVEASRDEAISWIEVCNLHDS